MTGMILNPYAYAGEPDPLDLFSASAHSAFDVSEQYGASADGTAIDSLTDQTGNGRTLSQVNAANRPTVQTASGMKVARFDGSNDSIGVNSVTDGASPKTVIILAKFDDASTTDRRLFNAGTDRLIIRTEAGAFNAYNGGASSAGMGTDDANWHVFFVVFPSSGSIDTYLDGGSAVSGGSSSGSMSRIIVGRRDASESLYWDGDVNYIGVWSGDLTVDNKSLANAVGQALADRAGITWTDIP